MDVDENGYDDLIAGAYESERVVILRSKIVALLKLEQINMTTAIDLTRLNCADSLNTTSIDFSFIIKRNHKRNEKASKLSTEIKYGGILLTMSLDIDNRTNPRAIFSDKYQYSLEERLAPSFKREIPINRSISIRNDILDKLTPIRIMITAKPSDYESPISSFCNNCAMYENKTETLLIVIPFATGCRGEVCQAEFEHQTNVMITTIPNPIVSLIAKNLGSNMTTDLQKSYELSSGSDATVIFHTCVKNLDETAYSAIMTISVKPMRLSNIVETFNCSQISSQENNETNTVSISCLLGNPLCNDTNIVTAFTMNDWDVNYGQLEYNVTFSSSSSLKIDNDNSSKIMITIKRYAGISIRG